MTEEREGGRKGEEGRNWEEGGRRRRERIGRRGGIGRRGEDWGGRKGEEIMVFHWTCKLYSSVAEVIPAAPGER